MHKTKILEIEDCLNLTNITHYLLLVSIIPATAARTTSLVGLAVTSVTGYTTTSSVPVLNAQDRVKYLLQPHSSMSLPVKVKKDDKLVVSYLVSADQQP